MKTWKKLLSLFLAVLMLCGTMTGLAITVSADETTAETGGTTGGAATEDKKTSLDYLNQVFTTPQAKLDTMQLKLKKGNYELYCDEYSGEVAVKNTVTGQILSTNPYDIGVGRSSGSEVSSATKADLMSQIIITYEDNGKTKIYDSYSYAAERDQITVKNIRNGIRVEYVIGREEARHLVPRMITDERFRTMILAPMLENLGVRAHLEELGLIQPGQDLSELDLATVPTEIFNSDNAAFPFRLRQLISWYGGQTGMKCLENQPTDSLKQALIANYPVLKKQPDMKFWTFDNSVSSAQLEKQEEYIKTYAPDYSYEEMDYDHQLTEYESDETNPPVFKMALEYTLDVGDDGTIDGLTVRMPVNGLSFNESLYQLTDISILPYMGCGNNLYDGYVFFPDGSGTLFAMEDLRNSTRSETVTRKVYGEDYAYHKISDTYQQTVRYPAFGIVEDTVYYKCYQYNETTGQTEYTLISGALYDKIKSAEEKGTTLDDTKMPGIKAAQELISKATSFERIVVTRGFAAIVEEGDALTSMKYYHAGSLANYDTVQLNFNPRPQDSYNLADSISVGTNTEWTVVSDRKYTGNFKLHYVMLNDETAENNGAQEDSLSLATGVNSDGSYSASWMGMAYAYRDYLLKKGMLTKLSAEETSGDIPLYIETFGTEYTTEKIASIPVSVKKALTSAADVLTIYEELQEEGIKNVNFKLTGYANGGMYAKMPYRLKWEKAVSKDEDKNGDKVTMQDLFNYAAKSDGLELFPDFDFAYVYATGWFDGLSLRKHVVRTIDDRYASKKEYEPTTQQFVSYYQLAVSPAYFSHFYEKFLDTYLEIDGVSGISVASLGNALNSDFDEDEPYNREDSRTFVKKALEYISQDLDVMVEGGNVYTWKYVKHILDAPLDSSRFIKSSYSVPFLGVVLHGYVNYAGSPLNMEGDVNYAKLKAIESGAAPYFILAYENTEILKEYYEWSHYYSVRYDIWKDDVVELYNELNDALKDLQDKSIVKHEFLSGLRVPDLDELEGDMDDLYDSVLDYQQNQAEYELAKRNQAISEARKTVSATEAKAVEFVANCLSHYAGMGGAAYYYSYASGSLETALREFIEADETLKQVKAEYQAALENGTEEQQKALEAVVSAAESTRRSKLNPVTRYVNNASRKIKSLEEEYKIMEALLADAESGALLISDPTSGVHESIVNDINARLNVIKAQMQESLGLEFKYTVDKAEMDTFFHTHIALLVAAANGEAYGNKAGIIGKAENLVDMLLSGQYGLMKGNDVEYTLLRFLAENRELTDAQLDAKYGLSDLAEGETSVMGLVKYARELFGTKYEFDPLLSDEKGEDGYSEVDKHILSYFRYMLYKHVSDISSDLLPELIEKFTDGSVEITDSEGKVTSIKLTQTNNKAIVSTIQANAKKAFDAHIKAVTDGDYKKGVAELVDAQIEAAKKTIADQTPGVGNKPVQYETPETMEADLRAYLTAYYYTLVMDQAKVEDSIESLSIVTVTYTTATSISTLVADRYAAMQQAGVDVKKDYTAMVEAIQADTVAQEKLELIVEGMEWLDLNDTALVATVKQDLQIAYLQAMANKLGVKTMPSGAKFTFANESNNRNTALSNDLIEQIKADGVTDCDLASYVAQLLELLNTPDYALKKPVEAEELEKLAKQFVSAAYLVAVYQQPTRAYYLDAQMGTMDKAVRDAVASKHDELLAALPEDATVYEIYDAILTALGNTEDSVTKLTREIAAQVSYYVDSGSSMSSDVRDYYIYLLFQSFSEQLAADKEPVLTIYKADGTLLKASDTVYKNAIKAVSKKFVETPIAALIAAAKQGTKRGELVDYSLKRLLSDEEMTAWVEDVYAQLEASKYLDGSDNAAAADQLKSDIESYLRYQYYQTLLKDKMKAGKTQTKFNVSEVYGDDLLTSSQGLKTLIRYFVPALCEEITEEVIDEMVRDSVIAEEDEEEETSKYLTNDGRIVAVTYGSLNGSSYTNDKTFLLNYNNFSVSVRYDGVTYTIPAYGYVVIKP